MVKWISVIFFSFCFLFVEAQNQVKSLIREGIFLYDNGQYEEATSKYKEALSIDPTNIYALYELAYTYEGMKQYDDAIAIGKKAVKLKNVDPKIISNFYVAYGNCLDKNEQRAKAIKVYKKGIKKFPDFYLLNFNLGVALLADNDLKAAESAFQNSVRQNPNHSSSHFYLGLLTDQMGQRIPSILAFSRFILLEPRGDRSLAARQFLDAGIHPPIVRTDGEIHVQLTVDDLGEENKANSFSSISLLLDLATALDLEEKYKDETAVDRFLRKFSLVAGSLGDHKDKQGFYWEYYAPFFASMEENNHLETFSYLVQAEESDNVSAWLKLKEETVMEFRIWMEDFDWDK